MPKALFEREEKLLGICSYSQNNMKAGQMFKILVDEYQKNAKGWWERVKSHKPIFSPNEYDEMERKMKAFRKEYGWRI